MTRPQRLKIEITAKDKENILIQLDEVRARIETGVPRDNVEEDNDNSFEYNWNY